MEVEEDLFFGEDVFFLAFGWLGGWDLLAFLGCGFFFDGRVDVEFVFRETVIVLMVLVDLEVNVAGWRF